MNLLENDFEELCFKSPARDLNLLAVRRRAPSLPKDILIIASNLRCEDGAEVYEELSMELQHDSLGQRCAESQVIGPLDPLECASKAIVKILAGLAQHPNRHPILICPSGVEVMFCLSNAVLWTFHGGRDDSILSAIQAKWPPKLRHQRNSCQILQNGATESR